MSSRKLSLWDDVWQRRWFLILPLCLGLAMVGLTQVYQRQPPDISTQPLQRYQFAQMHMGMPVELTVWASSREVAERACKRGFARVNQLENIFSDYVRDSETSKINRAPVGDRVVVSTELADVVRFSQRLCLLSDGVFDPGAGRVVELWRETRKSGELPDEDAIENVLQAGGINDLSIFSIAVDEPSESKFIAIRNSDLKLDFGGIAKGYIGDEVIRVLREEGIRIACYEAGGDIVCSDPPPDAKGWRVELPDGDVRHVSNVGVAVSGDTIQSVTIDGATYSHVVDLRTGLGVTTRQMAYVFAPRGWQSDALATIGCILPDDRFQQMLSEFEGATGQVIQKNELVD